ncbi:NUDIX hydrolase [Paenibacillus sp. IITD108]|uniref:NUDIX hydrolase n=1 Tax=Paenibacillus sp. IITD108 TaxID=3116649 RepID=UPI002F42A961
MSTIIVNWGQSRVALTWEQTINLPPAQLITSVHGFCFYEEKLLLVNLHARGWDFPGGHIELGETPAQCMRREALEEAYVEGDCQLLGAICVDHNDNPNWTEQSPYPKVGYQVFYRMNVTTLRPYLAEYEAGERIFIEPAEISQFYKNWHSVYQEILDYACSKISST